jgi:hypothetical protein
MKERAHVGHNKRPLENVSIFRYLKEFWNFVYLAPKVLTYIHYGTPAATKVRTGLIWLSQSWLGLFEQFSGFYKWSLCRV